MRLLEYSVWGVCMCTTYAVLVYCCIYSANMAGRSYTRFPIEKLKTHAPPHRRSMIMCWETKSLIRLSYVHVMVSYGLYLYSRMIGRTISNPIPHGNEHVSTFLNKFKTDCFLKELIDNTTKCLLMHLIHKTWNKQRCIGDRNMGKISIVTKYRRKWTSNTHIITRNVHVTGREDLMNAYLKCSMSLTNYSCQSSMVSQSLSKLITTGQFLWLL